MTNSPLHDFNIEGKSQKVSFIETIKVTAGIECDVYTFDENKTKDLGVIRIEPNCKTPLQKVLKGDKTIEGYISGRGKLIITKVDNTQAEYPVSEGISNPFEVIVSIGEKMQWRADKDSPLTAYEICFPPYQDGRYENLKE